MDYAECLTLLMRLPPISKPANLVQQAKKLQQRLSEETALEILQENDIKAGKEPRIALSSGILQQEQNDRALHHRRSHGGNLDSFSRITSSMMNTPQVRDLNKAIAGVMGTMQKNVGELVKAQSESLIGSDRGTGNRRLTVPSEFPSGIDRIASVYNYENQQQPRNLPTKDQRIINNITASKPDTTYRQMGETMSKCISVLEEEIFSLPKHTDDDHAKELSIKQNITEKKDEEKDIIEEEEEEEEEEEVNKEEEEEEENKEKDNSSSVCAISKDDINRNSLNEANLVQVLAALKHIRDVLTGKQLYFDSSIMDMDLKNPEITALGKTQDSNVVEDETIAPITPTKSTLDEPITVSSSSSIPPPELDTTISQQEQLDQQQKGYEKIKPLPSLLKFDTMLPKVATPYVPANPTPPKQQVKYRIEDLLSDPTLQSPSPTNDKFKWMLSNETENDTTTAVNSNDLFKSVIDTKQPSPRKRASFIRHHSRIESNNNNSTVDPLDAKNVDNRKSYEYDIF